MVTETDRNNARSAVVSAYHALDCVTIPFSFLHAFADAAADAVSMGAEPVKTAPAMAVKALEWVEGNPGSYTEIAESPFGHYSVWEINGTGCWSPWKQGSGSIVDGGLAGAKAAAQADYEARIRSALA